MCPRYRTREEMGAWRARDPVVRFRNWLVHNGWWDQAMEQELRHNTRQEVRGGEGQQLCLHLLCHASVSSTHQVAISLLMQAYMAVLMLADH